MPYARFAISVEQARASAQLACIGSIKSAAENNWLPNAWLLERQYPMEFSLVPARFAELQEQPTVVIIDDVPREEPSRPRARDNRAAGRASRRRGGRGRTPRSMML